MASLTLEQFADAVSDIMPVLMREFARQGTAGFYKIKVTMPQYVLLRILSDRGESSMSDLASALSVTTAAMTGVVDRLVRDGYVIRASDPGDRRVVRVKLTARGTKVVDAIHDEHKRATMKVFEMLTSEERDVYLDILTKIRDRLARR